MDPGRCPECGTDVPPNRCLEGSSEKRVPTWNVSAFGVVTIEDPTIDELYVPVLDGDLMWRARTLRFT